MMTKKLSLSWEESTAGSWLCGTPEEAPEEFPIARDWSFDMPEVLWEVSTSTLLFCSCLRIVPLHASQSPVYVLQQALHDVRKAVAVLRGVHSWQLVVGHT